MTRENDKNCGDWNNSEIRAYFYNGAYYYKIGSQVVKLDDKMNFVKVVDKIDAPDYNVQTSTLNRLRMCRENLLKTWSCSGYYSLDELDELLPEIDEKLREKNKIKEDIENLEKDKNKKRELEEYKRQLGIKRGQELFWSLFKNKAKREDIENFMCHDSKELIKLMKQIKKSGFMSDYNFLSKEQAIDLGEIIAVPLSIGGYGWNKDGQSWIDIHDRRDYLSEVINRNIFSKKALRKFFDEFELKYLRNGVDQEVADFIDCVMSDPYVLKHR